mgnify:CR=1 FL=1
MNGYQPYGYGQYMPDWQQQRMEQLNQQIAAQKQQLSQMGYGQPGQMQPQQSQPMPQAPRTVMVTSLDEIKGYNVLDGGRYIFVDTSDRNKIYTRQMDFNTGRADIEVYERLVPEGAEMPQDQPQPIDEVQQLKERVSALEAKLSEYASNGSANDDAKPASKSNDAATSADAGGGSKSRPNPKRPAATESE